MSSLIVLQQLIIPGQVFSSSKKHHGHLSHNYEHLFRSELQLNRKEKALLVLKFVEYLEIFNETTGDWQKLINLPLEGRVELRDIYRNPPPNSPKTIEYPLSEEYKEEIVNTLRKYGIEKLPYYDLEHRDLVMNMLVKGKVFKIISYPDIDLTANEHETVIHWQAIEEMEKLASNGIPVKLGLKEFISALSEWLVPSAYAILDPVSIFSILGVTVGIVSTAAIQYRAQKQHEDQFTQKQRGRKTKKLIFGHKLRHGARRLKNNIRHKSLAGTAWMALGSATALHNRDLKSDLKLIKKLGAENQSCIDRLVFRRARTLRMRKAVDEFSKMNDEMASTFMDQTDLRGHPERVSLQRVEELIDGNDESTLPDAGKLKAMDQEIAQNKKMQGLKERRQFILDGLSFLSEFDPKYQERFEYKGGDYYKEVSNRLTRRNRLCVKKLQEVNKFVCRGLKHSLRLVKDEKKNKYKAITRKALHEMKERKTLKESCELNKKIINKLNEKLKNPIGDEIKNSDAILKLQVNMQKKFFTPDGNIFRAINQGRNKINMEIINNSPRTPKRSNVPKTYEYDKWDDYKTQNK